MSYATTTDVQARYLERDLIGVTDETNQAIDMTRLQSALDDATAEIDGYLCVRYVLPLVDVNLGTLLPVPTLLVRACCDIAVYCLQTLRPKDDVDDTRRRYDGWIKMLRLMSTGDVQIASAKLLPGQATFPSDVSQSPGMTEFTSSRHPDSFGRRHR